MRLRRLLILNLVLAIGLSSIFLLPKSFAIRESAIIAAFPSTAGSWIGVQAETPEQVVKTLAHDTGHHRAIYERTTTDSDGNRIRQRLDALMVISGSDMNASIHRPERCFPAQGMAIDGREKLEVEVGQDGEMLPVTMLDASATILEGELKGKKYKKRAYYWFVGHRDVTNSHWSRTFLDMKGRVLGGYNQRWAYVMLSMHYGLEGSPGPSGEEVGKIIEELIVELYPDLHDRVQLGRSEG